MQHYLPNDAPDNARKYRIEYLVNGRVFGARDIDSNVSAIYHSRRTAARIADRFASVCTVYVYRYSQPGVCLSHEGNVYAFHAEPQETNP